GNPEPRITWIKNGIRLSVDDPRYQFLENGRRLRIRQVSLDDASTFSSSFEHGRRSEDIRLRCDFKASPTPITVWKKDGRQVASEVESRCVRRTLIISRPANDSDAGVYTCEVRNNIGSDMIRIEVVVQNYRFNLERQRLLITNLEASHAGLYTCEATQSCWSGLCPVSAQDYGPLEIRCPLITWQKNGAEIPRNDPYYRTLDSGNLHIPYVRTTDSGTFLCVAKNDAGSDTQLRMLEILGELSLA
uniref:Ig-like domain-containing protein n=1 Tax=Macrostomum lignano TaxID=282301 RepID=A0A1I8IYE1_9PLAT